MKEVSKFILAILILGVAILSTLFLQSIGRAAVNTTSINVNVSEVGAISVTPNYLEWIGISPGNNGTDQTITVTNIGSTTFSTGVYASVNSFITESNTSNPLGGANSGYAAGSYLVLKNSTTNVYNFVNRMEWNDSTIASSVTGKNTTYGVSWGKYRNKTDFWVWELRKDSNGWCSNTTVGAPNSPAGIAIGTTQGSYSLSGATLSTPVGNTSEYSIWTFNAGPLKDYCVAVRQNCQSLMIYKWDYNSSLLTSCGSLRYLNTSLVIGGSITLTANVFVPSGTPAGNATPSTLTITAA